jgi:hypothetical protein
MMDVQRDAWTLVSEALTHYAIVLVHLNVVIGRVEAVRRYNPRPCGE